MRSLIFLGVFIIGVSLVFKDNEGKVAVEGIVLDDATSEPIPFAKIVLEDKSGRTLKAVESDFDGEFQIKNIPPGKYVLIVRATDYESHIVSNLEVESGKATNIKSRLIKDKNIELEEVEVRSYEQPLINKDGGAACKTISRQDISRMPQRRARNVASVDYNRQDQESYSAIVENGFKEVSTSPLSTFSIDVDAASYSNTRRHLKEGKLPPKDAVRVEEFINYFNYDYPDPKKNEPFSITTEFSDNPLNNNNKLVHIGLQGERIKTENLPSNNLVFLIDVSGSMYQHNRLPLVKKSLTMLVDNLNPEDKVAIVVYAGAAGEVLPSTEARNKEEIISAIEQLKAGGSTAGGAGIKLAYKVASENFIKNGNNRVIICTDGDFNVGQSSDAEMHRLIEEKRETGVFLTCLGYGMGNYKDSKLETLANRGNGNYAYIDDLMEAKKVLVNEMGATLVTIAKDVKLQIEFNPNIVSSYRLVGYENRLLENEDFNDDTKDAGELGAGHSVTALYEIELVEDAKNEGKVDPLKYQNMEAGDNLKDVLTVKFRYKNPDGNKSKLLSKEVKLKDFNEKPSVDFNWSAAVAMYAMNLRSSEFLKDKNLEEIKHFAQASKGKDERGYRSNFIQMIELTQTIKNEARILD